jgi:hypothetical protein
VPQVTDVATAEHADDGGARAGRTPTASAVGPAGSRRRDPAVSYAYTRARLMVSPSLSNTSLVVERLRDDAAIARVTRE